MSFVRLKPFDKSKGHLKMRHRISKWKITFEQGDWHEVSPEAAAYLATVKSHGGRNAPPAFDVADTKAAAKRLIGAEKLAALGRTAHHDRVETPAVPDSVSHSMADDLNLDPTHDIELSDSPVDALTNPPAAPKPSPARPKTKPKPKAKKKKTGRRTKR